MRIIRNYGDLLNYLKACTPEQLRQRPMVMPPEPDADKVVELLPVFLAATVAETECEVRSAVDWNHHPEQIVILTDFHPFDGEENRSYALEQDGWRGDNTKKIYRDLDNLT